MVGADPRATPLTQQPLAGYVNYFIGKDPSKWHAGIPTFGKVGFHQVYPGVDLVYYGNQRHLEYDFIVAPHADPKRIQLHFAGAQRIRVNAAGDLIVRAQGRELTWQKPTVYQQDATGKHAVAARFRLKTLPDGRTGVRFAVGRYDTARALVIDPVLTYSTYLGGHAPLGIGDTIDAITVTPDGYAYLAGNATATDFPTTSNGYKTTSPGSYVFVSVLDPTGATLAYSTFVGGVGLNVAFGVAVNRQGHIFIAGNTTATDFPVTGGAFQTTKSVAGTYTPFISRLDPSGKILVYSTYLGGASDTRMRSMVIDSIGNAYLTGLTTAADFPVTPGAYQKTYLSHFNGMAFVAKLEPFGTFLVYSTFLGGTQEGSIDNEALGIAIDNSGNAYVVGNVGSPDFPTRIGSFQRTKAAASGSVGFLTKLNGAGNALLYSTFLGGSGQATGDGDIPEGIALDSSGNAYITGKTNSADFPVTPGAYQSTNHAVTGGYNGFVTRVSPVPIFPDFNNDGFTDLLIQNASTGVIASWFMHGPTWLTGAYFSLTPPVEYALVGAGDFSGNGSTTLVLQSRTTNQVAFWYTGGANNAVIPSGNFVNITPVAGWKVVGVGDFNGDGKSDLVFQNQTTNQVAIWFMNNYVYVGGVLMPFTPPTGWTVVGAGDFNADGFPDIAFQNQTTGQIALWYMNNSTYINGTVMTTVPAAGWKVVGAGDYNGDGSADLVFQNQTSNQAAVWYLQNGAFAGGANLSLNPPSGWKIVGPR
ncbi:MAG: hypothetical protein JWL77_3886 [Chthonomonadaceae bacterium]|nr:hypothetical protein [Chthonomonadaceae bacterium]